MPLLTQDEMRHDRSDRNLQVITHVTCFDERELIGGVVCLRTLIDFCIEG